MTDDSLSDRDRDILTFEKTPWHYQGSKEDAIRQEFRMSPTRYYQLLNVLIDRPAALAAEPVLVRRLLRLREMRRGMRRTG